jgi:hypothetical protein
MRHTLSKGMFVTAAAASGILCGGSAFADGSTAAGSPGVLSGNSVQAPVDVPVNICGNSIDVVGISNPVFGNGCENAHTGASAGADTPRQAEGAGPERTRGRHAAPGPVREAPEAGRTAPRGRHAAPAAAAGTGAGTASGARGAATGSPGLLSGNAVQAPVDVPLNACGNTVDVVALLNPAFGNGCGNGTATNGHPTPRPPHHVPPSHHVPPPRPVPPSHHVPPTTGEGGGGGRSSSWGLNERGPRQAAVPAPRARLAETGAGAGLLGVAGASVTLLVGGAVLYRRKAAAAHR